MEAKGEINSGGMFGPLTRAGGRITYRKNNIMSLLAKDWPQSAEALITICREFEAKRIKLTMEDQIRMLTVLRLAEVGVNAVNVQLRESASIHLDSGLPIDEGDICLL